MRPTNRIENVQRLTLRLPAPCRDNENLTIDVKHDNIDGNRIDSKVAFGFDFHVQFPKWET